MRLTRQGDYPVRVMVDLAGQAPDVPVIAGKLWATWSP